LGLSVFQFLGHARKLGLRLVGLILGLGHARLVDQEPDGQPNQQCAHGYGGDNGLAQATPLGGRLWCELFVVLWGELFVVRRGLRHL
jgi:hypothetical protein